jgi:hypothetical protein
LQRRGKPRVADEREAYSSRGEESLGMVEERETWGSRGEGSLEVVEEKEAWRW